MARQCQICKRKTKTSIKRTYSHKATKRRQLLNLQKVTYQGKKIYACCKCIKSLHKI